jgi:hypothetical protein
MEKDQAALEADDEPPCPQRLFLEFQQILGEDFEALFAGSRIADIHHGDGRRGCTQRTFDALSSDARFLRNSDRRTRPPSHTFILYVPAGPTASCETKAASVGEIARPGESWRAGAWPWWYPVIQADAAAVPVLRSSSAAAYWTKGQLTDRGARETFVQLDREGPL